MCNDREKLLNRLKVFDFILMETGLYLDAYPNNTMALDYYHKNQKLREEVLKEYTQRFGPISKGDSISKTTWEWVKDPWPWENIEEEI